MSNIDTQYKDEKLKKQLSDIIQGELVDLYGPNGYKSIMQTMTNICGKKEQEIITNFTIFSEMAERIFGRLAGSKILDPIKLEINKIGEEKIEQKKIIKKKHLRLLIADDEPEILSLYKIFLESKGKEITVASDGKKCVEIYRRETRLHQSENYFDVIVLDQKMPIMTGLDAAIEILDINPQQKIIFASGFLEKTITEVLTKINKAIAVIEKPFSLDVLDRMINNMEVFEELDKINMNQEEKETDLKIYEIMTILQKQV